MPIFKSKVRTRFAPSPTGWLHVGGLRTAFYSYLFAKQNKGSFILRIEDTDRDRFIPGAQVKLQQMLEIFGLKYDEGPDKEGDFGPHIQSQRLGIYQRYANELLTKKRAYYCFCTVQRLAKMRADQIKAKQPPRYDRFCLKLSREKIEQKLKAGDSHVIRLKIPEGETFFNDLIRGQIKISHHNLDDQILIKSDGYPTYHLAVVIDDHLMKISHVIRGEEWIPSTPKHIIIYKALNWSVPEYAHLPLLLNPDRTKLSKRQGDVSVEDYLDKGYLPEALLNFIVLLGWNPGTDEEIFTIKQLLKEFNLNKVQKAGAVFDINKLNWLNSQYIKKLSNYKLTVLLFDQLSKQSYFEKDRFRLTKITKLFKDRLLTINQISDLARFLYDLPDYNPILLIPKKSDKNRTQLALNKTWGLLKTFLGRWTSKSLKKFLETSREQIGLNRSEMFWPIRVAVSGQANSPDVFDIIELLEKKETINRLETALEKMTKL